MFQQGYLNEVIKKVTGSTVTYWIQQEVFREAKRLFYHTDIDVKQIAYELGYTDHSYFIRTFRKVCGSSPSKFRALRLNLVNKAESAGVHVIKIYDLLLIFGYS